METEKIEYAAWIGLDWGSYKHAICLQPADSKAVERCVLEQKPEALHSWFMNLLARFGGRKVAIAIEQTRGAVIHFLLGLDSVHIFPIHPKSLKNYRDALHPSGAKDDPTDAELLLQFLTLHRNRIKPWMPNEPDIRLLLRLVECRRKIVGKRIRLTNELTQLLKEYFPLALDCAGDLGTPMACDFLSKWTTLEKLQRKFFRNILMRRFLAAFPAPVPFWRHASSPQWDRTGAASVPLWKSHSTPALHPLPNAAEKQSGCIAASPVPGL
ncbi:MAG: IS110 family transposase [Acidobacteria bacterium]|nr:IS110 family transposase [Acidobacteriota bacterium]